MPTVVNPQHWKQSLLPFLCCHARIASGEIIVLTDNELVVFLWCNIIRFFTLCNVYVFKCLCSGNFTFSNSKRLVMLYEV